MRELEVQTKTMGSFTAVANKVGGELDGKKPLVSIFDECHALPDNQLRSALLTGMGWSTDTLSVTISTAGLNIMNYFYKQIAHGKMILETDSEADDKTLYILFTLDDKDLEREDILTNEDIWVKAIRIWELPLQCLNSGPTWKRRICWMRISSSLSSKISMCSMHLSIWIGCSQ